MTRRLAVHDELVAHVVGDRAGLHFCFLPGGHLHAVRNGEGLLVNLLLGCPLSHSPVAPSEVSVDARSLVRQADKQLYKAKENGRNRVECLQVSGNEGDVPQPELLRR